MKDNYQNNPTRRRKESTRTKPHARMLSRAEIDQLPGQEAHEKRTRCGKFYNLGGSLHQAVIFPEPVHFQNEQGEWEEIDNTLVRCGAGNASYKNKKGEWQARFNPVGTEDTVSLTQNGHTIAWSLADANAAAPQKVAQEKSTDKRREALDKTESTVLYPEIFDGADMQCTLSATSFKDEIIFKAPEALRPVTLRLVAPGLTLQYEGNGLIRCLDKDGAEAFTLPVPLATQAAEECGAVSVSLSPTAQNDCWQLTYEVDTDWAATAQYPIVLDPLVKTAQTSDAISMVFTSSAKPTTVMSSQTSNVIMAYNDVSYGKADTFLRFEPSGLPAIDTSYYVTSAIMNVRIDNFTTTLTTAMYFKETLSDWSASTITYNNRPAVSDKPFEYLYKNYEADGINNPNFQVDVTNQMRRWYAGQNYGLMMEALSNSNTVRFSNATSVYYKPYVTINYVSLAGLESYLSYENHAAGRAGAGYVSLYNGNLIFEHQETTMNGNLMPVSLSRYYNSCYRNTDMFGAGNGWKLNAQQSLHRETIGGVLHYAYMDGDGTRHHFKLTSGVWKDLSGLELTLAISGSTATITDKGNNVMTFDLPTVEFADNYANVKMLKSIANAMGVTATFATNTARLLTSATDGASRVTSVANNGTAMTSVTAPGMSAVSYGYTSGNLTSITHEDSKVTYYSYNAQNLLYEVSNHDGNKVRFDYYTSREPYRVSQVTYYTNGVVQGGRRYDYGDNRTTVTDLYPASSSTLSAGKTLIYHFNDYGNVASVNDELGYAQFAAYNSDNLVNHPQFVSKMQRSVTNYLRGHNFQLIGSDWTYDGMDGSGSGAYSTDTAHQGGRCYKLTKTSSSGRIAVYQTVTLERGKPYTASMYYKTTATAAGQVRVTYKNSSGTDVHVDSQTSTSVSGWDRLFASFTLPSNSTSTTVTVRFMAAEGAGTVYVDSVQLEDGAIANSYNMLINGDFTFNSGAAPQGWTAYADNTASDIVYTAPTGSKPTSLSSNTMRLYGVAGSKVGGFSQEIAHSGSAGDVYRVGGWAMSYTRPRSGEPRRFCLRVNARTTAGSTVTAGYLQWSEEWTGWQFAAMPIVIPASYSAIFIDVQYQYNVNYAEFGGLFLHKEEFGKTFGYDSKGNVLSTKNLASMQSYSTYDAFNNMLTYRQPGRASGIQYTMDYGTTDAERKQHLLKKSTSPMGMVQAYTYDNKGNVLTAQTQNSSASTYIKGETTYTANMNYTATQKDARAKTVTTNIDANKGTLTSVTDPNNQTVSYAYDSLKRMTSVSTTADSKTYKNEYAYTGDQLTEVKHNTTSDATSDVTYTFGYDASKRPTTVRVGSSTLSTNVYNTTSGSPLFGTLTKSTFGNGGQVVNTYDAYKRVVGIRFDNDTSDRYTYDFGANGQVARVTDTLLNRVAASEYDTANRPMRVVHTEGTNHLYTGEVGYDAYNNLASFKEKVGTAKTAYETTFAYDNESRPTSVVYGSTSNQVTYGYDVAGRISTRTVTAAGSAYASTYGYTAGGYGTGSSTPLVTSITQAGEACAYVYDDVGNITSATRNSVTTTYVYDNLGQLTRVNDPSDTTSGSTGTTWTHEYDRGGNITSKKRYAYTTGTVGTLLQTISYSYGDSNWKDKLTAYNSASISYDAIGNPLNDGTWTYVWEKGRQLKSMTKGTAGTSGYLKAEFAYNHDGLRIQKKITEGTASTVTTTNYTLHGKNIVHLTQGSDSLHYFYDAQNRPAVVDYNGTKYGIILNLQGDVIGIRNSSGTQVVRYTYDSWGKLMSATGTMASTLGAANVLRYRGYAYDEETGWYYLRSRYYNPEWFRFVNADTVLGDGTLLSHNLFAYCSNNPIGMIDPEGAAGTKNKEDPYRHMTFEGASGGTGSYWIDLNVAARSGVFHTPLRDGLYNAGCSIGPEISYSGSSQKAGGQKRVITSGVSQDKPHSSLANETYVKYDNNDRSFIVSITQYNEYSNRLFRIDYYAGSNPRMHFDSQTGTMMKDHMHIYLYNDNQLPINQITVPIIRD